MVDGDGMVRGSYDIAERVERLGVTPGSTLQAVLFHFAGGRRVPEDMVRAALAELRRRRRLTPEGRAAVEAFAATLAPEPPAPAGVRGTPRLGVKLLAFRDAGPNVARASDAFRAGEAVSPEVAADARAELAAARPDAWHAADHAEALADLGRLAGRKPNAVHARRGFGKDDQPRVSLGHFHQRSVREAAEVAALVAARHPTRAAFAGAGNFGMVYRVETPEGPRAVKVPAANDNHNVAWTRAEQTMWIRHEAGVANELAARGYTVVPRGVYTEFEGATPAFVREWGEPVRHLTPALYATLESELYAIEREARWDVQDVLLVFARPDGSVFVGDVGYWMAPKDPAAPPRDRVSDLLRMLLRDTPILRPDGAEWRPAVRGTLERLARLVADEIEVGAGLRLDAFTRRQLGDLVAEVRTRDAFGLPVPDDARAAAGPALELLMR